MAILTRELHASRSESIRARLWMRTICVPRTGCWEWTGPLDKDGYGKFPMGSGIGGWQRAPRLSYWLEHGEIGEGKLVCHKCDNRACVNPAHLFEGTPKQNSGDMTRKGRQDRGSARYCAKLTEAEVLEIKRELAKGTLGTHLARRFNISNTKIYHIKVGRSWKHVTLDPAEQTHP